MTILSFLFVIAVPTYQRLQRKAKSAALATDFRTFATAFQTHTHEAGTWPLESAAGVVPTGMTPEELKYDDWTHDTPMGGKFDWENNQLHTGIKYRAAITIGGATNIDAALLTDIDQTIDDGVLTTGNFLIGDAGAPLFVIEK